MSAFEALRKFNRAKAHERGELETMTSSWSSYVFKFKYRGSPGVGRAGGDGGESDEDLLAAAYKKLKGSEEPSASYALIPKFYSVVSWAGQHCWSSVGGGILQLGLARISPLPCPPSLPLPAAAKGGPTAEAEAASSRPYLLLAQDEL